MRGFFIFREAEIRDFQFGQFSGVITLFSKICVYSAL